MDKRTWCEWCGEDLLDITPRQMRKDRNPERFCSIGCAFDTFQDGRRKNLPKRQLDVIRHILNRMRRAHPSYMGRQRLFG